MTEMQQGFATLRGMSNDHLAISLVEMGTPSNHTFDKINAELNEDLLGENKYSKGKKEFLGVNVFRRLLNEAMDGKWSWEIMNYQLMPDHTNPEYVMIIGRLYLPGLGFRDGIGTATLDKKDNSASFAIAGSNAFKNALKQSGFGASLLDDNWADELFEEDFEEDEEEVAPPPKKQSAPKEKPATKAEPKEEPKAEAKSEGGDITDEQKESMAELKEIYNIETSKQMLGFMQIWNPELKSMKGLTSADIDTFLNYYDDNEDEFEDFDPEEV